MKKSLYIEDDYYQDGTYRLKYGHWYRQFRTFNEIRQHHHAECDGYKVRRKRFNIPIDWDDCPYSQMYGRDWKRFTRRKHQYRAGL